MKQVDGSREEPGGSYGKEFREDHYGDSSLGHTVKSELVSQKEEIGNRKEAVSFSLYIPHITNNDIFTMGSEIKE